MSFESGLLEHHLAFLATHRGEVRRAEGHIELVSSHAEFSYSIVLDARTRLTAERQYLVPAAQTIDLRGTHAHQSSVVYMRRDAHLPPAQSPLIIQRVADERGIQTFSDVQAHSFEPDESKRGPLRQWLNEANQRNRGNDGQHFLVAFRDGLPVGVTLLIEHQGLGGIYAVATLPEERGRGVASTLLADAAERARQRGIGALTLQVAAGSAAERLYTALGFAPAFATQYWRRR